MRVSSKVTALTMLFAGVELYSLSLTYARCPGRHALLAFTRARSGLPWVLDYLKKSDLLVRKLLKCRQFPTTPDSDSVTLAKEGAYQEKLAFRVSSPSKPPASTQRSISWLRAQGSFMAGFGGGGGSQGWNRSKHMPSKHPTSRAISPTPAK